MSRLVFNLLGRFIGPYHCYRRGPVGSWLVRASASLGSSGPGSNPGRGHCVVFLSKTLYSRSVSLRSVYKWVPTNLMLGYSCDGLASHLGRGRRSIRAAAWWTTWLVNRLYLYHSCYPDVRKAIAIFRGIYPHSKREDSTYFFCFLFMLRESYNKIFSVSVLRDHVLRKILHFFRKLLILIPIYVPGKSDPSSALGSSQLCLKEHQLII